MIISVKIFLIFIYILAVVLDFLSQQLQLISLFKSDKVASSYATKNKLALLSRGFSFFLAPLLGYLLLYEDLSGFLFLFLICTGSGLLGVIFLYIYFSEEFIEDKNSSIKEYKLSFIERFGGYIAFGIAINSPFVLNIVASRFPSEALWLVQVAPMITAISTFYIIFYYEVRLAKLIDQGILGGNSAKQFLFERLYGRLLAFLLVLISYIIYA